MPTNAVGIVDRVMKDASEEEKAEATEHWFNLLRVMIDIVNEDEARKRQAAAAEKMSQEEATAEPKVSPSSEELVPPHPAEPDEPNWKKRLYQRF